MVPTKEADMELYAGIDLHSNNSVVTVLDEEDRTVFAKRLPNDLAAIIGALRSCAGSVGGVAVCAGVGVLGLACWGWRAGCVRIPRTVPNSRARGKHEQVRIYNRISILQRIMNPAKTAAN